MGEFKRCPKCEVKFYSVSNVEDELCPSCSGDSTVHGHKIPAPHELKVAFVKLEDIEGETYYADTHAEFLNTVFGTDYEQWYKSTWKYTDNILVWMVQIDGKRHDGWINTRAGNKITEQYVGKTGLHDGKPITVPEEDYKIVACMEKNHYRTYTILGMYKLNREESTPHNRYYYRVGM